MHAYVPEPFDQTASEAVIEDESGYDNGPENEMTGFDGQTGQPAITFLSTGRALSKYAMQRQ